MPTVTIALEYTDEAERLALEQAVAFLTEMRRVATETPDGTVLAACEQVALRDGHALLRNTLAAALRGRIAAAEQKGGPPAPGPARAAAPATPRGGTNARPQARSGRSRWDAFISPVRPAVKAPLGPTACWASTAT
jgi:hypothetical protein